MANSKKTRKGGTLASRSIVAYRNLTLASLSRPL